MPSLHKCVREEPPTPSIDDTSTKLIKERGINNAHSQISENAALSLGSLGVGLILAACNSPSPAPAAETSPATSASAGAGTSASAATGTGLTQATAATLANPTPDTPVDLAERL